MSASELLRQCSKTGSDSELSGSICRLPSAEIFCQLSLCLLGWPLQMRPTTRKPHSKTVTTVSPKNHGHWKIENRMKCCFSGHNGFLPDSAGRHLLDTILPRYLITSTAMVTAISYNGAIMAQFRVPSDSAAMGNPLSR